MAIRLINNPPSFDDTCSCTWSNNTGNFIHHWTINELKNHYLNRSPGHCIKSSTFFPEAYDQINWHLRFYPKGDSVEHKDSIAIYLHCVTSNISKVTGTFILKAHDYSGESIGSTLNSEHIFKPNEVWQLQRFIDQTYLKRTAQIESISCEIKIVIETITIAEIPEALKPRINDDFGWLFESQDFSDVTLTVGGKDIPAHKLVLAARSPVFSAMFKHNMEELKTNRVAINDTDHEVVMEMLQFIYTDKAPNLEKMASNLLGAADKYGLTRLKAMCAEALRRSLSVDNALNILVLSDLHNIDPLKDGAVNFICKNIKDMIETASFESMACAYPKLMIAIMRTLSEKKELMEMYQAREKSLGIDGNI